MPTRRSLQHKYNDGIPSVTIILAGSRNGHLPFGLPEGRRVPAAAIGRACLLEPVASEFREGHGDQVNVYGSTSKIAKHDLLFR